MNDASRHELDAAIDRTAARMVAVREDDGLLSRTMAQLPEREVTPWFMAFRAQVAAAAALLLVAFAFARPSRDVASSVVPPVAIAAPIVAPRTPDPGPRFPDPATSSAARQASSRRAPVVSDRPDHERSLAPVDAIDALELVGIAPLTMEIDPTAAPEPLVVPELALDPKGDS